MNALENIERVLEEMGQNLRGGASTQGLQPRDVLRAVLHSLEENRVEGLDHRMYAPNSYSVQVSLDEEERSRLLPFLKPEEIEASILRYCQKRKYHFRGPLAIEVLDAGLTTLEEPYHASLDPRGTRPHGRDRTPEKVIVHSRFSVPPNWESDLANQFTVPVPPPLPVTEHDADRRDPPTYSRPAVSS